MLEHGRISSRQLAIILFSIRLAPVVCTSPTLTATPACRDTWLVNLAATGGGLALGLLVLAVMSYYPGRTLTSFAEAALGRFLGRGLVIVLAGFLFLNAAVEIRFFSDLHGGPFWRTPSVVFVLIISLTAYVAARSGLEVIARVAEFLFFPMIFLLGILFLLALRQVDPANLLPVAERGLGPLAMSSVTPVAAYGSLLAWLVFRSNLAGMVHIRRALLAGVSGIGVAGSFIYAVTLGVLGGEQAPHFFGPVLALAQLVAIRDIIQGMDLVIFITWMTVLFSAVSFQAYAALIALGEVFRVRDHLRLVGAAVFLTAALSQFLFADTVELRLFWDPSLWGTLGTLISFTIPLALLAGSRIRGLPKGGGGPAAGGEEP